MATTNFQTENNTFRKLMGNGLTYRIPPFQRDYSWDSNEWEDLWIDITSMQADGGEPSHYMGYLVLQSNDEKTFSVIDGQQRLTTISLIILAVLKNLKRLIESGEEPEANQKRFEQIQQTYLGYLDPVTLITQPKLTLNRNSDHYFQTYIVPLENLPKRGFRASVGLLRKAFEWFENQVQGYLNKASGAKGVSLAELVEQVSDRLFFTVITVTDELNAYKVFETLNSRGVRLSATDLLKNHLFSILDRNSESSERELRNLEERWEGMIGRLQSEKFPDFLRIHWNSRHDFVRQSDLFKRIRLKLKGKAEAFDLIRNMESDLDDYLGLISPEASDWSQEDKVLVNTLKMFRVRQPYPLLLAAKRHFSSTDFTGVLRAAMVISLRYNIIGSGNPSEQERIYNSVAKRIEQKKLKTLSSVLDATRPIYTEDKLFKAAFSEKTMRTTDQRNKNLVRYILCELERKVTSGSPYDSSSSSLSVEHVLPENVQDGWDLFNDDECENLKYRLGNMTLMQSGVNRDAKNFSYIEKRKFYFRSNFVLTQKLAQENEDWTPERIAARQSWMADQATSIWRISQLS